MSLTRWTAAAALLSLAHLAFAHGNDHDGMNMGALKNSTVNAAIDYNRTWNRYWEPSYAGLSAHSSWMLGHIVLMTLAWFFILPIGEHRVRLY